MFTIRTLSSNLNAALCIYEPSKTIGVCDDATSVKPKTSDNLHVSIYPNPTTGLFNLTSSVKNIRYKIYNNVGEEIISNEIDNYSTQIDLSNSPSGVYILQLISENSSQEMAIIKD